MKNKYVFILTITVICSLLLSLVSEVLKERQSKNIAIDRKKNILSAVGVDISKFSILDIDQYFIDNILTQIPDEYTTSYAKIGIGTAGWIDEESNLIIHSPNTNWKNVDLKSLLEKEINIPITIIND